MKKINSRCSRKLVCFVITVCLTVLLGLAMFLGFNPFILIRTLYASYKIPDIKTYETYAGLLTIPSVGIQVDCIDVDNDDAYLNQIVTDRANCAARMYVSNNVLAGENNNQFRWVIADHNYQNFDLLNDCEVEDYAYFTFPDGSVRKYVVTKVTEGVNDGTNLTVEGESLSYVNTGGIVLYTCKDSTGIPVYVVFLQPVDD